MDASAMNDTMTHPRPPRVADGPYYRWDPVLSACTALWLLLVITGGRMPWQPIRAEDDAASNAMLRQVIFSGVAAVGFWRLLYTGKITWTISRHPALCGLITLALLSALWSIEPMISFKRAIIPACGVTLLLAIVHTTRNPFAKMQRIVVYTLGFAIVGSLCSIVMFPLDRWMLIIRPGLAGWTFHPNTLGPICGVGLLVSAGIISRNLPESILLWFLRLAFMAALILTLSLNAITFAVEALILFALLMLPNYARTSAWWVAGLALVILLASGLGDLSAIVLKSVGRDPTLTGRTELWEAVLANARTHPLLGEGFGAFWLPGRGLQLVKSWNPRQSHNGFIDVFNELGAVGLVLLLIAYHGMVLRAIRRLRWSRPDPRRRMLASVCGMAIALLCIYSFGETCLLKMDTIPFFVLTWITIVLGNPDRNNSELLPMPPPPVSCAVTPQGGLPAPA